MGGRITNDDEIVSEIAPIAPKSKRTKDSDNECAMAH